MLCTLKKVKKAASKQNMVLLNNFAYIHSINGTN